MTQKIKYPSTPLLPWTKTDYDDNEHVPVDMFAGKRIVVTEKMDGENTTIYRDAIHARSLDSQFHPSRAWVRALQGKIGYEIPDNHRICGENMFAEHSIKYNHLSSYFLYFSIWDGDYCLDWQDTVNLGSELGLDSVPVIWSGFYDQTAIDEAYLDWCEAEATRNQEVEGYVIRDFNGFYLKEFVTSVAKYVRPNHIQTDEHWLRKPMVQNGLEK